MAAYQALYRKYRPQTFDDVVGQLAITQTIKTQLQNGQLSHAYLFTGSRGTGKEIGMAQLIFQQLGLDGLCNGQLTNHVIKCLWSVFSI